MAAHKLKPPTHIASDELLLGVWNDLMENVAAELLVKENLFTLEITATLMGKFRGSKPLSATEMKELKKHLVSFGLARDENGRSSSKPKKNSKYFARKE